MTNSNTRFEPSQQREVVEAFAQAAAGQLAPTIDEQAAEAVTRKLPVCPTLVGQQISAYRILSQLGAGGMGEVYLAEDTRLGRQVAIKLLPAQFSADADRVRRFEQEARAVSILNHPNIITIHEIGQCDESHYIVTEFVEGQTLRKEIASSALRRLELPQALEIARQVASALSAAHGAGIMHRDIKPENIMLRPDGLVKVLDFGIAKLSERELNPATDARTTAGFTTEPGIVMGTLTYMSPEQARGLKVDLRTDLFSLGVVLYEMVTGLAPFGGPTTADIVTAILSQEPPPLKRYIPEIPEGLDAIVSKALHKDREERYQTAKELLTDLKSLSQRLEIQAEMDRSNPSLAPNQDTHRRLPGSDSAQHIAERTEEINVAHTAAIRPTSEGRIPENRNGHNSKWLTLAAAIALVVGAGIAYWFWGTARETKPEALAPTRLTPLTSLQGSEMCPSFSPDGKQIAFSWDGGAGDNTDIYVKLVGVGEPLRLTNDPAPDSAPVWSPDGRYIAFVRQNSPDNITVMLVPILGGAERSLGKVQGNGLSWSPDGRFLAILDNGAPDGYDSIFLLSVETGERRMITPPVADAMGDLFPTFSPDGKTLAFIRYNSGVDELYTVPVTGGVAKRMTFDNRRVLSAAWTPDGRHILFISDRSGTWNLWKIRADGGTPEQITSAGSGISQVAVASQGGLVALTQEYSDSNIWRLNPGDKTGQNSGNAGQTSAAWGKLIASSRQDDSPHISPDGQRIVFTSGRTGSSEIWICQSDGTRPLQLTTFGGPQTGSPRWSPGGEFIVFDSRPEGHSDIFVISAGGGQPRRLTTDKAADVVPSWSRDGQWIYFTSNRTGERQVWKVPADGGEAIQITKNGGFEPIESPDGKFLYYTKNRDVAGILRVPVNGGEELPVPELAAAGSLRYWDVSKTGIYFSQNVKQAPVINFFSFATNSVTQVGVPNLPPMFGPRGLAVAPDDKWLLYVQVDQRGSDILLLENYR